MSRPEDKGIVEKVKDTFQVAKEKFGDTTQRVRDQAQQASDTVRQKAHSAESKKEGSVDSFDQQTGKEISERMINDATKRFDDVAAHTVDDHALQNATEENYKVFHATHGGTECAKATTLANDTEDEKEKTFLGD